MADTLILVPYQNVRRRWDRPSSPPGPIEPPTQLAEWFMIPCLDDDFALIVTPGLALALRTGAHYQATIPTPRTNQLVSVKVSSTGEISVHRTLRMNGWTITLCYQSK